MSPRGRPGLALGSGLAVTVVLAVAVPSGLVVCDHLMGFDEPAAAVAADVDAAAAAAAAATAAATAAAAVVVVDVTAVRRAVDAVQAEAARISAQSLQFEGRAREAERGERLRHLARVVADAGALRRVQGQVGPKLRATFAASELGDLQWLAVGPDTRWLLTRAGALVAPAESPPTALTADLVEALATTGRDEEPLRLKRSIEGRPITLVRRCLPKEDFCIVDVDPLLVLPSIDLAGLRQQVDALQQPSAPSPAAPPAPTPAPTPAPPLWPLPAPLPLVLVALAVAVGLGVALRLRKVAAAIVSAALRLRAGLGGRPVAAGAALTAEIDELERAIDAALAAVGVHADHLLVEDERRARLLATADVLDAAKTRGGVERVAAATADDVVTARMVQSANGLLDALDERTRRLKVLVEDAGRATGNSNRVLAAAAQRIMRLVRLPGLAPAVAAELTSLGNAMGARVGPSTAFDALAAEMAPLMASSSGPLDQIETIAALRDLPPAEIVRLTSSTTKPTPNSESPFPTSRPIEQVEAPPSDLALKE